MSDQQTTNAVKTAPVEILYRLRDMNADLLYVGITRDWPTRMTQHQRDKPWWSDVAAVELVKVHGTRQQIEAIERAVIKTEQPTYNKTHNAEVRVAAPKVRDDWHGGWGKVRRLTDDVHYPLNKHLRLDDKVSHTVFGLGSVVDLFTENGTPTAAIVPDSDQGTVYLVDALYTRLELANQVAK